MRAPAFTAIILAGQRPGRDPLADHFGQPYKALIEVAGEAMLSRVARTLAARGDVRRIVVLAQSVDMLLDDPRISWLRDDARLVARDGGSSIVAAITDTLAALPDAYPFLLTTADNVLLDDAIIDAFVGRTSDVDIAVALVERATLEAAYPGNRRTWLPFRGGAYSGANLFWLGTPGALKALAVWRGIEQKRKKARAVLGAFGLPLALMLAVRLLTLDQAIARAGRRLGVSARAVALPFAEACIDVDKPSDHAMAEAILQGRES